MISYRQADWGDYQEENKPEAFLNIDEGQTQYKENSNTGVAMPKPSGMQKIYWLRPLKYEGSDGRYMRAYHPFRDVGFQYWEPHMASGTHGFFEKDIYDEFTIDDLVETAVEALGSNFIVTVNKNPKAGRLYTIGLKLKDDVEEMPEE